MGTQQIAILLRKQRFPNCKNNSRVPRNPCQDFISRHSRRSHSHSIRVQVSKGPSDYNYQCFVKFWQFNGTVGNVMDIICSRGKSPQDEFPNFILVEFPKFKGPPFMEDHPTWIHVPAYVCTHRRTHASTHTRTYIHTCTHVHIHCMFIKKHP